MVHLKVNGRERSFDGDPEMPLLWYLRDILGMTGTKFGCGMALCGACTVLQNGKAIRSCTTQMGTIGGAEITTIEGISEHGPHGPVGPISQKLSSRKREMRSGARPMSLFQISAASSSST